MKYQAEFSSYRDWLDGQEKSKTTKEKNLRDVEKFRTFCKQPLETVTKQDVQGYKEYLIANKYKPASINSYLISLNNFLKFMNQDSLRAKTLKIQGRTSLNNVLNEQEYAALLETAKNRKNKRLYYLIRTIASGGIRISELSYITTDMLESGKTFVHIKGKTREIIIPQQLCQELRDYCNERRISGVIFQGKKNNTLIDKAYIWRELKALAKEADVPKEKVYAHNFRHFFAKQFMAEYHDIVDLADILGHTSIETTRIYTRTSRREKQERINALNL
ncbi:MAG: site-specific integrase [Spirochaetaceae bacterium]|jgi:site-specific recombinase XerD|nr:site-specific integrase [Spirochaetaceae bacterium]